MMPIDLVLVRHGESEGNVARRYSEKGDNSFFTEQFRNRHSSRLRLTDKGRQQARMAGMWIKKNIGTSFDRYFAAPYARAMETGALMEFPDANWHLDFYLRERDAGLYDILPEDEKMKRYPEEYKQYMLDPFYWTPPNGESIAQVCLRADRVLHTLHRECSDQRVLISSHGLMMWAFIIRIERLTPMQYLNRSQSKKYKIHNCQIIHYSRRNSKTGELARRCEWVRSVCPVDMSSSNEWTRIKRPTFTNSQLMRLVEESKRVIT